MCGPTAVTACLSVAHHIVVALRFMTLPADDPTWKPVPRCTDAGVGPIARPCQGRIYSTGIYSIRVRYNPLVADRPELLFAATDECIGIRILHERSYSPRIRI